MSQSTSVTVPTNLQLPAHLQTADAAALVAAHNAAAAGGIKIGGFPRISIKGGKFHEVDGGETKTYMVPSSQPGQPDVPLMVLQAVIVGSNPALVKTYYVGEFKEGDDREPVCSSENGITPDAHIQNPQAPACATCPQNVWGSKISKASGKEIKACDDSKRVVIIPAADLGYKALALTITKSSLSDWGTYVKTLSGRGIPVNSVVTNITFDHTAAHPKLLFSFSRFLTAEEFTKVTERGKGDDVKAITTIVRSVQAPKPGTGAPAQQQAPVAPPTAPVAPTLPPATPPVAPPQQPPAGASFGAAPAAPVSTPPQPSAAAPAQAPAEAAPPRPKRTRKAADPAPADGTDPDIAHLPAALLAAVQAVGKDSPAGLAILMQYPKPAEQPAATSPEQPAPTAPQPATPPGPAPATGTAFAPPGGFAPPGQAAAPPAAPATVAAPGLGTSLRDSLLAKLKPATPPA